MNKREFLKINALVASGVLLSPTPSFALFAQSPQKAEEFTLPALDYKFDEFEPIIDTLTMQIHHGKHHAGYVNNLNAAIKGTTFENQSLEQILANLKPTDTAIRNNAGGHYNHSLFWKVLAPRHNKEIPMNLEQPLLNAINEQFSDPGSPLGKMMDQMSEAGKKLFGSGWVWLVVDKNKQLKIMTTPNQDNPLMANVVSEVARPILGIDVWEHAYYLRYQNNRGNYLSEIWRIIDWNEVSRRYEAAIAPPKPKNKEIFAKWTALDEFHKVMSATYHPAEKGDLAPIKARSGELAQKAKLLAQSEVPADFNKPKILAAIKTLGKDSKALEKLVRNRKTTDAQITQALNDLHGVFHDIVGLCKE